MYYLYTHVRIHVFFPKNNVHCTCMYMYILTFACIGPGLYRKCGIALYTNTVASGSQVFPVACNHAHFLIVGGEGNI